MQKYKSHKIVEAAKIDRIEKLEDGSDRCLLHYGNYHGEHVIVSHNHMNKHEPKVGGYYVRYPDGYESYSPAEAFEEGYAAVDAAPGPKAIVINNNQSGDTFIGQTPPHTTLPVGTELYTAPPAPAKQARDPAITALRDHFACHAPTSEIDALVPVSCEGCAAYLGIPIKGYDGAVHYALVNAKARYQWADAMLAERVK